MIQNKYGSLNVLSQQSSLNELDITDADAVNQVMAMVNAASVNRSDRRKLAKTLSKTQSIIEYADKRATEKANTALANKAEMDMVWLYAMTGITLAKFYHWKEDPDQEHGQITSFFERMTRVMNDYNSRGYTVEDVAKEFEEMTGIELIPERH